MLGYFSGTAKDSPRHEFWYVNDDGQVVAARYDDWKVVFLENRAKRSASGASPLQNCACR
jgi:arylsulfatase